MTTSLSPLTLYCDRPWISPWVMHAVVALEEKQLPYQVVLCDLPLTAEQRVLLSTGGVLAKVPMLVHGETWISESLAISEYLAETFPIPDHPRIFPADLRQRARARQIMSWLRTDLEPLRAARPTSSVFGEPMRTPLPVDAQGAAAALVHAATQWIDPARLSIADAWCIADVDLALAVMRLVRNDDLVPPLLHAYAEATWARPSVQAYLARR